jgi:hypothetical protein
MGNEVSEVREEYTKLFRRHWRTFYGVSWFVMALAWPYYIFGDEIDHKLIFLVITTVSIFSGLYFNQNPLNSNSSELSRYRWNRATIIENLLITVALLSSLYIILSFVFEFIGKVLSTMSA